MLFARRRRRRGIGLSGILLIGGLLYGTGAGGMILDSMKGLPSACSAQLGAMNPSASRIICGMAGQMVAAVTGAGNAVGGKLDDVFASLAGKATNAIGGGVGQGTFDAPDIGLGNSMQGFDISQLAALMSSEDALSALLQQGPSGMSTGGTPSDQLQAALDSFSIGQRFLTPGSQYYQPNTGLSWMQQGANQQEYGLLPQLSLGGLYMNGGQGVAANPQAAVGYYSQALQSMQVLQQSNDPAAKQMLATLPVAPAQLQQEIIAAIRMVKPK